MEAIEGFFDMAGPGDDNSSANPAFAPDRAERSASNNPRGKNSPQENPVLREKMQAPPARTTKPAGLVKTKWEGKSAAALQGAFGRKSHAELKEIAISIGAERLLRNRMLSGDKSSLAGALVEFLTKEDSSEGEYEHDPEWFEAWLQKAADTWPSDALPPPEGAEEAVDPHGRWGAKACGVEVRPCANAKKGNGAFAVREIAAHSVVGVYRGETLTQREYSVRHGWKGGMRLQLSDDEQRGVEEREGRLAALDVGTPAGGARNAGSYCFQVLPDTPDGSRGFGARIAYMDAEDPNRSSWYRYTSPVLLDFHRISHATAVMRTVAPCTVSNCSKLARRRLCVNRRA